MYGRRKTPTRTTKGEGMPPYGPEAIGLKPYLAPSPNCSWCGHETIDRSGFRTCPECDTAPPFPQTFTA